MSSPTEQLLEVPDADAAEQSRELRPADTADTPAADTPRVTRPAEADEFDTVEQNLVVDQDDEEEYR